MDCCLTLALPKGSRYMVTRRANSAWLHPRRERHSATRFAVLLIILCATVLSILFSDSKIVVFYRGNKALPEHAILLPYLIRFANKGPLLAG